MQPLTTLNTNGIPDNVLLAITSTVIVVIILCAALVGFVHLRDKAKERRSKK